MLEVAALRGRHRRGRNFYGLITRADVLNYLRRQMTPLA